MSFSQNNYSIVYFYIKCEFKKIPLDIIVFPLQYNYNELQWILLIFPSFLTL